MRSRSKELTINTSIIILGRISTQFIVFLLLPLYTTILSTEEYGTVDLITTLVQLIVPVMSLMIDQGVFRHLLNCKDDECRREYISCGFFLLACTSVLALLLYGVVCLFEITSLVLWLFTITIATAFSNFFLQIARGLKHTSDYALGSFICSVVTIVLNVLCIATLHMGAVGMLIATLIGNVVCCLFLFIKLRVGEYISFSSFRVKNLVEELKYSLPLIPNQLSIWVMNGSDRMIITLFLGAAANGILSVSHKFPAIYMSFFNVFQLVWHETGAVHYYDDDRDEFFTDMISKIISVFTAFSLSILVMIPIVFEWLVNSAFQEAYYNIPIYMVASMFNIVVGLLGVVYVATKNTKEIAKTTIIAALLNIIVNVVLVKYIGLYAASISTLVGYFVTMIYRIIDSRKYIIIKFKIKQIITIVALTTICCSIYYLDNKIISLIFLPIFVITMCLINKEIIDGLTDMISEKVGFNIRKFRRLFLIFFIIMVAMCGALIYIHELDTNKQIQEEYTGAVKELNLERRVVFSEFGQNDFTCTGLTYDSTDNSFWIGDYGALNPDEQVKPRLVEIAEDFSTVIREVRLDGVLDYSANLQGVAYDSNDDCLWLAVGKKVVSVSKNGEILTQIDFYNYIDDEANGIAYNSDDDSIWVLTTSKYLLHCDKKGKILQKYSFNYFAQDHICVKDNYLFMTVGADYRGEDNYICKIDANEGQIIEVFKTDGSNAIEGVCLTDGKMMVANDGLYHSDSIGHSYITIYSYRETD